MRDPIWSSLGRIVGGPDRMLLASSLVLGSTVEFRLDPTEQKVIVTISSLQREDGSLQSWNFEGYIASSYDNPTTVKYGNRIRGYYNTLNVSGNLLMEPQTVPA